MILKRRVLPLTVVAALAFTVSACGGGGSLVTDGGDEGTNPDSGATSRPETASFSVAVFRDYSTATSRPASTDGVDIEGLGTNQMQASATIDGERYSMAVDEDDFGSDPNFPGTFHKRIGNRSVYLWDAVDFSSDSSEFSYLDLAGWAIVDWTDATATAANFVYRGFTAFGSVTAIDDKPLGSATYEGHAYFNRRPADRADSGSRETLNGDLTLMADFEANTIRGMIDSIEVGGPFGENFMPAAGQISVSNGMISDSQLRAELTGTQDFAGFTGDMNGEFYGPAAAEVGGVLQGMNSRNNTVTYGWFGGKKR